MLARSSEGRSRKPSLEWLQPKSDQYCFCLAGGDSDLRRSGGCGVPCVKQPRGPCGWDDTLTDSIVLSSLNDALGIQLRELCISNMQGVKAPKCEVDLVGLSSDAAPKCGMDLAVDQPVFEAVGVDVHAAQHEAIDSVADLGGEAEERACFLSAERLARQAMGCEVLWRTGGILPSVLSSAPTTVWLPS